MHEPATMNGACHCGAVKFTVKLAEGLERPRRCNCSLCRMRGAVVVTARRGDLRIASGQDQLRLYRFNTMKAEHYFCATCGIYTHHRRRSNPDQLSVNVACLEGVSPFDFARVPVYDGIVHHNDRPGGPAYRIAGYVSYQGAEPE
ncbi:MAG TPA: GFA family protein [Candidatus Binataceae bacterium]|nr:GFA family protein [Candidatus Binataceae bacterium]